MGGEACIALSAAVAADGRDPGQSCLVVGGGGHVGGAGGAGPESEFGEIWPAWGGGCGGNPEPLLAMAIKALVCLA